jgi:hypothetical protein
MPRWLVVAGMAMLLGSLRGSLPAAETIVEITTLSNDHITGPIRTWNATRLVIGGERPREVAIADVLSLRFPRHQRRATLGPCVVLVNGDRFAADAVRTKDEQLVATWTHAPLRKELTLPLETVSAMVFASSPGRTEALGLLAGLSKAAPGADTVQLIAGDRLTGEFRQLDGGFLEFAAAVGPLKLDRSRIQWLGLDPELSSPPRIPATRWIAFLTDGSRITASDCQPREDFTLQLAPLVGGRVTVPWHELVRLQPISPRVEPLSQRQPVAETFQPYLDGRQVLIHDRSVAGSPLTIRGEEFVTGLGMRSRMTATYALEPGDRQFRSAVGVDDAATAEGSVRFRIEVDGRDVWTSPLVTGQTGAIETPLIDLSAARRLTLIVEFGERGDVGDLADWCDPVILRH